MYTVLGGSYKWKNLLYAYELHLKDPHYILRQQLFWIVQIFFWHATTSYEVLHMQSEISLVQGYKAFSNLFFFKEMSSRLHMIERVPGELLEREKAPLEEALNS